MNQEGIRYYLMGLIVIILVANIPEVATPLRDKFTVLQPQISSTLTASFNDLSAAIIPLVGRIGGVPKLAINGKQVDVDTSDDMNLTHGQSLSIEQINKILENTPAAGTGKNWTDAGIKYSIDAAYMLAIFYYESNFATNQNWAGYKPDGTHTYNIGNIICAGYSKCYGRFRDYSDWDNPWWAGISDNTRLLASYRDDDGIKDFGTAIMKWAPPSENNTQAYISGAEKMIREWRNTNKVITNENGMLDKIPQLVNGAQKPFGEAQAVSAPITEDPNNDFGFNVKQALDASGGNLRNVVIKDGERWSFNATIGPPVFPIRDVAGVPGGGWCDLACRYVQVFKGLGLRITHGTDMDANDIVFLQHGGIALNNCTVDESPYIWSAGNMGFEDEMQDLIVNNRTGKTIRIAVVDNSDGTATIVGKLE